VKPNRYVALVHRSRKTVGVIFPDFPGCVSAGDTVEEALANAADALRLHVSGMRAGAESVPKPRTLEQIRDAREDWIEWNGAVAAYVLLLPPKTKTERINFTIEKELADLIDHAAKDEGLTRSAWLAEAARARIGG
jgi:predicted RNase H-like HicB family nuclease